MTKETLEILNIDQKYKSEYYKATKNEGPMRLDIKLLKTIKDHVVICNPDDTDKELLEKINAKIQIFNLHKIYELEPYERTKKHNENLKKYEDKEYYHLDNRKEYDEYEN